MAIQFPATPSDGQIVDKYKYDATATGWRNSRYIADTVPTGAILPLGHDTVPVGWLLCDGSVKNRADYPNLFGVIGTNYNTGGETATQFRLPNLKGRVPVGKDTADTDFNTVGKTGGFKDVTLTIPQMPSHTHIQNAHNHSGGDYGHGHPVYGYNGGDSNGVDWANSNERRDPTVGTGYANIYINNTTATNQNTGGGQSHPNMQPYVITNYIIKAMAAVVPTDSELANRVGILESRDVSRTPVYSRVDTSEGTTSTSYTNLATNNAVTLVTGSKVLVTLGARTYVNSQNAYIYTSVAVSGATTIAASDSNALHVRNGVADMSTNLSRAFVLTVTPGTNTFTMKHRVGAGTGYWEYRDIIVQNLDT